jgi:hypothetical protein
VAGAPGMVIDAVQKNPNWHADSVTIVLPRSRVEAARWLRDHSDPDDVLATNVHCLERRGPICYKDSTWLSAYAERSVLVEGWGYSPRAVEANNYAFWDPALLRLNDQAFTAPTPGNLRELRERHGVRWLVVDRTVTPESTRLADLAVRRFENGRMAVYELRPDSRRP